MGRRPPRAPPPPPPRSASSAAGRRGSEAGSAVGPESEAGNQPAPSPRPLLRPPRPCSSRPPAAISLLRPPRPCSSRPTAVACPCAAVSLPLPQRQAGGRRTRPCFAPSPTEQFLHRHFLHEKNGHSSLHTVQPSSVPCRFVAAGASCAGYAILDGRC